jgi:death-on-curing family protein
MARRVMTVAELAKAAGLDADEALIHLWEAGLDRYKDPKDRLRRHDVDAARHAVGLPTGRDLMDPKYWMTQLELDDTALRQLLLALGTPMTKGARTLPKGAVAKLRRYANQEASTSAEGIRQAREPEPIEEPFEWRMVGHERKVRLLSEEEVEAIHWELVRDFAQDADPIDPPGVRSPDLLASAVFRQHTALGEQTKYPTVEMAAAALFHAIVHDHPFFNGNKRTALVAMLVLLDENGVMPTCDEDELFRLVLRALPAGPAVGTTQARATREGAGRPRDDPRC